MSAGRHRGRRSRASLTGRCTASAVGVLAIAAAAASVATAPARPDDPTLIAPSARAALEVPVEDPRTEAAGLAEQRASRGLPIRSAVAPSPAVAAAPTTPPAAPPPKAAAAAQAPAVTQPAPAPSFSTSTTRTGAAVERGLSANAMKVLNAVRAAYPQLQSFGGIRSDPGSDHSSGQAIDIMIPGYAGSSGRALGDALAAFVQAHAAELSVDYVIWRQRIWSPGRGGWRAMADRGDVTANHVDHVHVSVR
ncbi:MAG: hypothetical protein ACOYBY_10770 [Dermatophilaceae bacterium]